jgi:hypothetical protein
MSSEEIRTFVAIVMSASALWMNWTNYREQRELEERIKKLEKRC